MAPPTVALFGYHCQWLRNWLVTSIGLIRFVSLGLYAEDTYGTQAEAGSIL